jgi:hypothetical protein
MKKPPKALPKKVSVPVAPGEVVTTTADAAATTAGSIKTYIVRVWDEVERAFSGAFPMTFLGGFEALASKLRIGDRIFLQGWSSGGPTCRARLAKVLGGAGGQWAMETTWGWSRGGEEPEKLLAGLSLKPEPDQFPVYGVTSNGTPTVTGPVICGPVTQTTEISSWDEFKKQFGAYKETTT